MSAKVKLHSLFLILSSAIIPVVGVGQQGVITMSNSTFTSVAVAAPYGPANAPVAGSAFDERFNASELLPVGGRYLQPDDTTKQRSRAKAKEEAVFKKPKVSGKTSKRKARRAKTSG